MLPFIFNKTPFAKWGFHIQPVTFNRANEQLPECYVMLYSEVEKKTYQFSFSDFFTRGVLSESGSRLEFVIKPEKVGCKNEEKYYSSRITLTQRLNYRQLKKAVSEFFTQLRACEKVIIPAAERYPAQELAAMNALINPTKRVQKRRFSFLSVSIIALLSAVVLWPDNNEYLEINDPEILALIEAKEKEKESGAEPLAGIAPNSEQIKRSRSQDRARRTQFITQYMDEGGVGGESQLKTTSVLSDDANQALLKASATHAITLNVEKAPRAGNAPFMAFIEADDDRATELLLGVEPLGYTAVMTPVNFAENENGLLRVIASYCSDFPKQMWQKEKITEDDLAQAISTEKDGKACDWQSALINFGASASIAMSDGIVAAPFVIAPNGAVFELNSAKVVAAEQLAQWLKNNEKN